MRFIILIVTVMFFFQGKLTKPNEGRRPAGINQRITIVK
jgi:hypothetical protein